MQSEFSKLPVLSWRGQKLPVMARSVSFAHESVQHKLQRRNEDLIEMTGAHNLVFTYTIPFRQGIYKGPYEADLFGAGLQKFFRNCRDKSPGELIDPYYGVRRAVPSSFNDDTDMGRTDGVDVRIEFTDAPLDGSEEDFQFPTFQTATNSAKGLVTTLVQTAEPKENPAILAALKETDDGGVSYRSLLAIGAKLEGVSNVALSNAANPRDPTEPLIYASKKVEESFGKVSNPDSWSIRNSARKVRDDAIRSKRNDAQSRKAKIVINPFTRSLTSIAATYGVSVSSLIAANPELAKKPLVAPGVSVVIPQS